MADAGSSKKLHIGGAGAGTRKGRGGGDAGVADALDRFTTAFETQQQADRTARSELQTSLEREAQKERTHQKELADQCKTM